MTKTNNKESELKCSLDASAYKKLLSYFENKTQLIQTNQVNTFFDSNNAELQEARWALRLREESNKFFLTCKGPSVQENDITVRPEIEVEISKDKAIELITGGEIKSFEHKPSHFLFEKFGNLQIKPFLEFSNSRTKINWEGFLLELDHSKCCKQHLYELEVELEKQSADLLKNKLKVLFQELQIPWKLSKLNKLAWAIEQTNRVSS